ncbi:hypothetical protein CHS0354_001670 [Potamilus streckersoni]|uniref:Cation efflux protein transmembrane domain-containing protein n=1 Tax=Potamilus streckersoni TaxID=2493646 RepID=A0AAE0RUY9_9BIVA|nr:hypothetical protein CHS0354_001670 [Potamilus streckersoni]
MTANVIPDLISSSVSVDLGKGSGGYTELGRHGERNTMGRIIHPFFSPNRSAFGTLVQELTFIQRIKTGKKILTFLALNVCGTITLLLWCHSTNSMALTAYTYLTIFDIMSLLTCLLSVWVRNQKPSQAYSFGYERFEVLAVFASTMLAQLGALFVIKESVERLIQQPEIHTGRLLLGMVFAFLLHMMVTYSMDNKAMTHVVSASSSSWLQEHMTDMSESICHVVPGLSKLLLPRINPFALIAFAGGLALAVTYILIDTKNNFSADTFAAISIAVMMCGTMFPMSVYTGKILLQTSPSHILGQLDKLLREASTLDGVLEFRNENFWTLSFGVLAGSLQVRVRRDADEQLVLAHVHNRLSNLVPILTIQIFKDDWTRASSYSKMNSPAFTQSYYSPGTGAISPPLGHSPVQDTLQNPTGGVGAFKPLLITSPFQNPDYQSTSHSGPSDLKTSSSGHSHHHHSHLPHSHD